MTAGNLPSIAIQRVLKTVFIGRNIIYYPILTSTMDAAREAVANDVSEGTVIIAGEQTGGRGRMKRAWFSPPGNIAMSIILYPEKIYLPYLVMVASLAACESIEAVTGLETGIKWPNDVLIDGKKVCGILIENGTKGGAADYSIVGIGVNVALRPEEINGIAYPATGLEAASGKKIPVPEVVGRLLNGFEKWYRRLPDGDRAFTAWRERLVTPGQRVTVKSGDNTIQGVAESVDRDGALLVRQDNGKLTRVVAGDVTLRY
jgi:BirA family biotin operon repressor/biotin-[acetyl-CoA-carboxylase] ligase